MWKRFAAAALALVITGAPMATTVEVFVDGGWYDMTANDFVLTEDPITIFRGADSLSVEASPGSCTMSLYDKNKNGQWSNRVPGSPLYRKLGRNTAIRVTEDGDVRCVMEVPKWEPRWELGPDGGVKVRVPIEAAGILRRLIKGAQALQSPSRRSILASDPLAYWPLEDKSGSTQAASGLPSGLPMVVDTTEGAVGFSLGEGLDGSPAILDASTGGRLDFTIPEGSSSTEWRLDFVARFPTEFDGFIQTQTMIVRTQGTYAEWQVLANGTDWRIIPYLPDGTSPGGSLASGQAVYDGELHHYTILIEQDGADIDVRGYQDGVLGINSTLTTATVGRPTGGTLWYSTQDSVNMPSIGHIAFWAPYNPPVLYELSEAAFGYPGETAGRRIERLLDEVGIPFVGIGDLDDSAPMGPQTADTLIANLEAARLADQGCLFETRTELGLSYRTRVSLYNQYGPQLDYSAGHIAPPLEPSEDDTFIENDVTVTRLDGSSARSSLDPEDVVDPYHVLSTGEPPTGVGVYDKGGVQANVQADEQLHLLADWLRHLGTWDEMRYPQLTVEFAAPDIVADPALAAALVALDSGDQLRITGLPAWLPPDDPALLIRGYTEVIGTHTRSITWNLVPGWPWEVWQMDSGASTVVAPVASNGTSLKLATSAGPEWETGNPLGTPYFIQSFGNAMKVTSLVTDTAAFIAAGAVAHGNNASVSPGMPAGMTPDVGQTIFGMSAIRNSGTGVPGLPTGYTNLCLFGNVRIFGKYYVTGDAAPTCSFTGGAANADTSARLFGFSGVSLELDDGKYGRSAVSPQTLLNSSAQNIAFPLLTIRRSGCVALLFLWKQDDATGIATPASMDAEMADNSTTTGDDQLIAAYYDLQSSATDIAAGSAVVTGGAAAISRGIVLALRPLQTATVERGVNGVSTSIPAGEAVNGWRLGVLGL